MLCDLFYNRSVGYFEDKFTLAICVKLTQFQLWYLHGCDFITKFNSAALSQRVYGHYQFLIQFEISVYII